MHNYLLIINQVSNKLGKNNSRYRKINISKKKFEKK